MWAGWLCSLSLLAVFPVQAEARVAPLLPPPIVFLAGEAARQALLDDQADPYFSRLQPLEMAAKTGAPLHAHTLAAQRAETRRRYRAGVRDFTPQEQVAIRALVKAVYALIGVRYPRLAVLPWHFIKVSNHIEGGLPHTRGDNIIVSQRTCDTLVQAYRSGSRKAILSAALGIVLHEQVHVLQRREPGLFTDLYTHGWGFLHTGPIPLTPWQRAHQMLNPDGQNCCWVFPLREGSRTDYIWPQRVVYDKPVGAAGVPRLPEAMHMIAVHVRPQAGGFRVVMAQGRPVFDVLLRVSDYTRVFGISYNLYHPNEVAADMFVKLVMYDALVAPETLPAAQRSLITHALLPVRHWARRALGGAVAHPLPILKGED